MVTFEAIARNLRRNETTTIGLIVPDNSNSFFAEIARGVEDVCFQEGYRVFLCNSDENPDKEYHYCQSLISQQAAGVIFITTGQGSDALQLLVERGIPVVQADRELPDVATDVILADNHGGAYQATRHLLDLGHRRIACLSGPTFRTTITQRLAGYRDALAEHGLPLDPALLHSGGDARFETGFTAAPILLGLSAPPTAVLSFNDLMAVGFMHYAAEVGLAIPEQLSVVGFDDVRLARFMLPALTTVAQPKYEMGRQAADLLLRRIRGDDGPPVRRVLDVSLVVRRSTAPPGAVRPR